MQCVVNMSGSALPTATTCAISAHPLLSLNRPTYVCVLVDAPWAYVGCEGSDVYVLNLDTMELSGYVIHWNKL